MTKDFLIGFLLGVLIVLLLTWPKTDDDDTPDDRARQGTPKYSDNTIPLGEVG